MIHICIPTTPERRERRKELLASIEENTKDIEYDLVIYENNDGGWVKAVLNMIKDIPDEEYVVLIGDDIVVKAEWLKILWERFIQIFPAGDGMAQPFDEIHAGGLCQHPLAKAGTIRKYLYPGYIHNFSDNDMTDQLIRDVKYLYVPESIIEHKHWVNGKAEKDATYEVVFNKANWAKDEALYIKRKNNGYKE